MEEIVLRVDAHGRAVIPPALRQAAGNTIRVLVGEKAEASSRARVIPFPRLFGYFKRAPLGHEGAREKADDRNRFG